MGFFAFVMNYKFIIALVMLGSIIAGQSVYTTVLKSQKATLIAQKETIDTQLTESQANLVQLQNNIKAQNDAITRLKSDSDTRLAANAIEIKKAQQVASTYKKQALALLNRVAPPDIPQCNSADLLIIEEIRNAKK